MSIEQSQPTGAQRGDKGWRWESSEDGGREQTLLRPRTCSEQLTLPGLWAETGVGAQPIQAGGPVLTLMPHTVIRIHLTVQARES